MHAGAIVGLFIVPLTWKGLVLSLVMYFAMMAVVTIGYHRYFSHRSFKTSRAFQFVLALVCQMSAQKGVLWWAAHHRHHHKYSDKEEDLHSPTLRGFWWSHVGWILARDYAETRLELGEGPGEVPRAALAQPLPRRATLCPWRGHVRHRRPARPLLGMGRDDGPAVARHVHRQLARARLGTAGATRRPTPAGTTSGSRS